MGNETEAGISQEMQDEIRDFFVSTAGSVVLDQLNGLVQESNDLRTALNLAQNRPNPELDLARKGGFVDGLDAAIGVIDKLRGEP